LVRVVDWQDELRMKMMDSAKDSNARARKIWGGSTWDRSEQAKENGVKGGRPSWEPAKPKKPPRPLSQRADTINKLLVKDWKVVDIADVLGVSHQAISQIIKRYGLPRVKGID